MINPLIARGLRVLGLTNKEAEALVVVVAKGPITASGVSREIGVHYPVVYRLLSSLESKGWIEASYDRPKFYRSMDVAVAVDKAAQNRMETVLREAETVREELLTVKGTRKDTVHQGTWIMRGWETSLRKARDLAKKAKRCVFIVGKDPVGESEVEELLKNLSQTEGYINIYLVADEDYTRLKKLYPEVNYQITRRNFKADPTRFVTLFIIFDEKEALFVNACYKGGVLEKDKVYTTWEKNPEVIEILMEGNNLRLKEWTPG